MKKKINLKKVKAEDIRMTQDGGNHAKITHIEPVNDVFFLIRDDGMQEYLNRNGTRLISRVNPLKGPCVVELRLQEYEKTEAIKPKNKSEE